MPEDARAAKPPAVTREIAGFIAGLQANAIPAPVLERGRIHMLDTLGLALAGADAAASTIMRDHVAALGARGAASVLGTDMRTAPRCAALVNGTAMHVDNFDDTGPQAAPERNGGIHASAAILPAALALAEEKGLGGTALAVAYHAGVEVASKLNHAIDMRHYQSGYHVTGTLGAFGAAAAAARLLDLDTTATAHALAGAASRASGLRANFGFMVEQAHTGLAAEAGLAAADLAARGLTGAPDILETSAGWFDVCGGVETGVICGRLGNPWAFVAPGLSVKPWPSGSMTHPGLTLLKDMMRRHGLSAEAVDRMTVRTNERVAVTLRHPSPATAAQARFSLPFCLAVMLVEGDAGMNVFTDEMVRRPDIRAVMQRIDYRTYDAPGAEFTNLTTLLDVHLKDGTVREGRADFARGSNRSPMGWDDALDKFMGCAAHGGWDTVRARDAAAMVAEMETIPDIRALTRLLTRD